MNNTDTSTTLIDAIADLQEETAMALVRQRLDAGDDSLLIIEDCQEGMRQVGERYERHEYYLAGLIIDEFSQFFQIHNKHKTSFDGGKNVFHIVYKFYEMLLYFSFLYLEFPSPFSILLLFILLQLLLYAIIFPHHPERKLISPDLAQ